MSNPSGYHVCAGFRDWDVVIHLPTLERNLLEHGHLKLTPWHWLSVSDNPNDPSSLQIKFNLTAKTGMHVQSTIGVRNGKVGEISVDVEPPKMAVDGCKISGWQSFHVQTEETIAMGRQVQACFDRLIIEEGLVARTDDGLSEEPNGSSPAQITQNGSDNQEYQRNKVMRPPKKYPVCAKFRDWYVVIHRPTLVENLLQYGYPHLVPWLQLLVPASPAEPATLHLYLHLDFKSTVQPIDVWRYDVAADIGFECERPRVAVDGYTLIDGCVLTNVETEETIALIERVRLSLKKLITEESMKDPRVMTAILRTWQLRARATGCTDG